MKLPNFLRKKSWRETLAELEGRRAEVTHKRSANAQRVRELALPSEMGDVRAANERQKLLAEDEELQRRLVTLCDAIADAGAKVEAEEALRKHQAELAVRKEIAAVEARVYSMLDDVDGRLRDAWKAIEAVQAEAMKLQRMSGGSNALYRAVSRRSVFAAALKHHGFRDVMAEAHSMTVARPLASLKTISGLNSLPALEPAPAADSDSGLQDSPAL